jgi:uncharacterized LabA/DUF88 family protein
LAEARLKIAVFIDFDNIEIGVKTTLGAPFDIGAILEAIKERGEVITKVAYGDWKRAGDHSRLLTQHAIRLVQRNLTPGGDKNGADINLALDALEMAFTHHHINAFVIVGGDSDFITLVEKLKQYDKKVFVVGGRAFTSIIMQRNCHEFIAYENVVTTRRPADRGRVAPQQDGQLTSVLPLVRRAMKVLADREVTPQLGLLKSTLLQLDSTFSERSYGAGSFRDFMDKLASAGHVTLRQTDRSVLVELTDEAEAASSEAAAAEPRAVAESRPEQTAAAETRAEAPRTDHRRHQPRHDTRSDSRHQPRREPAAEAAAEAPEDAVPEAAGPERSFEASASPELLAEGVQVLQRLFRQARTSPRFPMYLRNVKQFARSVDDTFDERKYGYRALVELLRACQRDNFFRLERDRQGVLRVYPGTAYYQPQPDVVDATPEIVEAASDPRDAASAEAVGTAPEVLEAEPVTVIETAPPPAEAVEPPAIEVDATEVPPRPKRRPAASRKRAASEPKPPAGRGRTPRKSAAPAGARKKKS